MTPRPTTGPTPMHDVITAFVDLVAATSGARVALGPPGR